MLKPNDTKEKQNGTANLSENVSSNAHFTGLTTYYEERKHNSNIPQQQIVLNFIKTTHSHNTYHTAGL